MTAKGMARDWSIETASTSVCCRTASTRYLIETAKRRDLNSPLLKRRLPCAGIDLFPIAGSLSNRTNAGQETVDDGEPVCRGERRDPGCITRPGQTGIPFLVDRPTTAGILRRLGGRCHVPSIAGETQPAERVETPFRPTEAQPEHQTPLKAHETMSTPGHASEAVLEALKAILLGPGRLYEKLRQLAS